MSLFSVSVFKKLLSFYMDRLPPSSIIANKIGSKSWQNSDKYFPRFSISQQSNIYCIKSTTTRINLFEFFHCSVLIFVILKSHTKFPSIKNATYGSDFVHYVVEHIATIQRSNCIILFNDIQFSSSIVY